MAIENLFRLILTHARISDVFHCKITLQSGIDNEIVAKPINAADASKYLTIQYFQRGKPFMR